VKYNVMYNDAEVMQCISDSDGRVMIQGERSEQYERVRQGERRERYKRVRQGERIERYERVKQGERIERYERLRE
jgi:hypothetical protein